MHAYICETTLKTVKWYTNDKLTLKYNLGCSVVFVLMTDFSFVILNEFALAHRVSIRFVRGQGENYS